MFGIGGCLSGGLLGCSEWLLNSYFLVFECFLKGEPMDVVWGLFSCGVKLFFLSSDNFYDLTYMYSYIDGC